VESIGHFLGSQPFIALFLVIGLGYAAGRINIAGFSLGIGAVLFAGLAVGAIAPKTAPPRLLGLIGLVLFLYGIGIQYGKDFFAGLVSPLGIKANLLALVAVVVGCAVAIVMADFMGFGIDCKMADRGQITDGILDGPLAMDNAINAEAAKIKHIVSPVAGRAQILIVPDLEAGNMLAKNLIFLAEADAAGLVLGAAVPIVLTSRADSVRARMASTAVAALYARYRLDQQEKGGQ